MKRSIPLSRRDFIVLGAQAMALLPFITTSARAESVSKLVFAGPPAPLSIPLARLAKQPAMTAKVSDIAMQIWRTPDIMRSRMLSGEISVTAAPVNAAAILYNKGLPVRLMDVNNGGILSILTRDPAIKKFTDLKGKKLLLFFRGDIPDMIVRFLATKQDLNPDKDMELSYVDSPFEALQMLLSKRADTVLLSEPAATAAVLKGKQSGMEFGRIILQDVWTQITGSTLPLPLGGTMCQASLADEHPELVKFMQTGIMEAVRWINGHPAEAAQEFGGLFKLKAPVLQKSLEQFPISFTPAREARKGLEYYFSVLMDMSPKLVGGKLPDDGFYFG